MSAVLVNLSKKVQVVLDKRKVASIKAQVGFSIDLSGSMEPLFTSGAMQQIISRVMGIAVTFDDDGSLDMWGFSNGTIPLPIATEESFSSYVSDNIISSHARNIWGSTSFAPTLEDILFRYFGGPVTKVKGFLSKLMSLGSPEITSKDPVYLIMLTDGDADDVVKTRDVLLELMGNRIFIQFICVGTASTFGFPHAMERQFDNIGCVDFADITKLTDEDMYDQLISDKVVSWYKGLQK